MRYKKIYWTLFIVASFLLLAGYLIGDLHFDTEDPRLKGLTLLQHFGIHYVTGILFGLLFLIIYFVIKKQRANEPLILLLATLWSHWPDIRFAYRQLPHDAWEIIFFFHTVIDERFSLFWLILSLDIILVMVYVVLINEKFRLGNLNRF